MSLIATYQLDTPVCKSLFEQIPDLRVEIKQIATRDPHTLLVTFWAETDHWTEFETELEDSDTIKAVQHFRSENDRALYQVRLPVSKTTYWDWTSLGGILLDATVTREGVTVRMEFPDQKALSTYRDWCLIQKREFSLKSLTDARSEPTLSPRSLTPLQRELVASAIEHGYFEIPRRISMEELAAKHDISDQAASERLRRGLSNLLEDGMFDTLWASPSENALKAR